MGHQVDGQEKTDNNVKADSEHGTGKCPLCFSHFCSQKIDAHCVKDGFTAAAEDGGHHSGKGIRSVGFKYV